MISGRADETLDECIEDLAGELKDDLDGPHRAAQGTE
jgi:hypothetical protein